MEKEPLQKKGNAFRMHTRSSKRFTRSSNCGAKKMRKTTQSKYEIWVNIMLLAGWSAYVSSTYYNAEIRHLEREKVTQNSITEKQVQLSASTLCKSALATNDLARQALPNLSTSLLETQQPTIITTCAPHFPSSSVLICPPPFPLFRYVTYTSLNLPFPLQVR